VGKDFDGHDYGLIKVLFQPSARDMKIMKDLTVKKILQLTWCPE
jgi:hypothetical protein